MCVCIYIYIYYILYYIIYNTFYFIINIYTFVFLADVRCVLCALRTMTHHFHFIVYCI